MSDLDSVNSGKPPYRGGYPDYAQLSACLRGWADRHPELIRLQSLCPTPEGRELWLLTIGPEPDRTRPAVWIDGNMHASELAGSSVAMALAETFLRLHLEPDRDACGLPDHVRAQLREVLVYVLPRMSPDGAEAVLRSGRFVRSVPRDCRPERGTAQWRSTDVDGDGLALLMRQPDEDGDFVESAAAPGLMLQRQLEDVGPFYRLYPEGVIDNFDGEHIPDPHFLADNPVDLNRNFPWGWAQEPQQAGAGAYPLSEPESRAVVDFVSARPHIFAWLNLHTFGGVFIRPLGHQPDSKMDVGDLALFRQIEAWNDRYTGYPTVSGYHEFLYEPDKPLHGDLTDFAYHQRGCVAYVCELWDFFRQVGLPEQKRFVDHYSHLDPEDVIRIARWDREHNGGRLLRPWRSFEHPQLGSLEVGGLDPRFGVWNPPEDRLDAIADAQAAAFLRVAALAPALEVTLDCQPVPRTGCCRVTLRVRNTGYLPTHVLSSARDLPWNEPLHAVIETEGCSLAPGVSPRRRLGHLEGWGRGRLQGMGSPAMMRSRGTGHRATANWILHGSGRVKVRVGACRVGWRDLEASVQCPTSPK